MSQKMKLRKEQENSCKILLVDDNSCLLEVVYQILGSKDYQVTTATSGEGAIEELHKQFFDLVITDLNMGEVNGIEVLKKAKELNPETIGIIMTANHDLPFYLEELRLDVCDCLLKPFDASDLLERVFQCLNKRKSRGSNRRSTTHSRTLHDRSLNV